MDKELIHCRAINRRDFAKLVLGLFGTAGSGFASVSAAAKAAEAAGAEVLRVLPYGVGPCWRAGRKS